MRRCQDSSPVSDILDFKHPSWRWGKVQRSEASDCQTQTHPPAVMCLEQSSLFYHVFTPGWFSPPSPLSIGPSVPPPLPVFVFFFDISGPVPISPPWGVLTAAQMKTLHQAPPLLFPIFEVLRALVQVSLHSRSVSGPSRLPGVCWRAQTGI